MKRTIHLLPPILAVLMAPSCTHAGTVLLEDDFSGHKPGADGSPLWRVHSGEWKVTPQGFEGADCEGHFTASGAQTGRKEWQDYTVSLRLKVLSRGSDWRDGPWLGVRHRNSGNVYTVGFYTRMTALHKASSGKRTTDDNPLAQSATTIKDSEWHNISITAEGQRITVKLDGTTIIEAADDNWNDSRPLASGGVVLAARKYAEGEGSTRVLFDDVRVEALGVVPDPLKLTLADAVQAAGEETSMLEFMQSRRDRRYTRVPRHVLAFYYTWYGRPERHGNWVHWGTVKPEEHDISASTHYPAKGAYDSHDPEIIDWHIDLAKGAGMTGFIATWWGQGAFDDRAFEVVLGRAARKDFKVTVYWETAPGKGRAQIDQAVSDLLYLLNRYGSHPAFLQVDGKPVIFVYGRVMGQVPLTSWPSIIREVEEDYDGDFVLIADGYRESFARALDGVHTYNICGAVRGKTPAELREWSAGSFESAVSLAKGHGKISCITIIPGYDDTKIRKPGLNAERQDGDTYRVLWEEAIKADPDWVLVTSWNEWHEGSEIEPSWEDGDKYIKLTGEYAPRFMATPHSKVAVPESPSALDPEKATALRGLYQGRTIGILPGYAGEAVFWLADAGVPLRELAWRDLLDPATFNAKSLPLALHAGTEHYVQTLDQANDVERALQRYLGEGGLLVSIPAMPFPFYYNEQGESVVGAGRLGFPIAGSGAHQRDDVPEGARVAGWEAPPPGRKLSFDIDTDALPGLPASVPFPRAGDLRWRPATEALVAEDDVYVPLAALRDEQGKAYGDGIVYVEHRASAPKGGKNLYVWMRMPDALPRDELLFALFRFAAEKIGDVE